MRFKRTDREEFRKNGQNFDSANGKKEIKKEVTPEKLYMIL